MRESIIGKSGENIESKSVRKKVERERKRQKVERAMRESNEKK